MKSGSVHGGLGRVGVQERSERNQQQLARQNVPTEPTYEDTDLFKHVALYTADAVDVNQCRARGQKTDRRGKQRGQENSGVRSFIIAFTCKTNNAATTAKPCVSVQAGHKKIAKTAFVFRI